jgi:hypothetical protein
MPNPSSNRLKRPSDPIQLAKLIGDIATGQVKDEQLVVLKAAKQGLKPFQNNNVRK